MEKGITNCYNFNNNNKQIVSVTGATQFLGQHTCLKFLQSEKGKYKVRAILPESTNHFELKNLRLGLGSYFDQLEIVKCDLNSIDKLANAIKDSTYLVHTLDADIAPGFNLNNTS